MCFSPWNVQWVLSSVLNTVLFSLWNVLWELTLDQNSSGLCPMECAMGAVQCPEHSGLHFSLWNMLWELSHDQNSNGLHPLKCCLQPLLWDPWMGFRSLPPGPEASTYPQFLPSFFGKDLLVLSTCEDWCGEDSSLF